jgi:hypothetical protein
MSTIKVNSIVPNSGTHVSGAFTGTFSGSIENGRLDRLESFSSSLDAAFATDSQLSSLSASFATRINAATNEQDLSGLATKVALNDFTASYVTDSASFANRINNVGGGTTDISALNSFTASAATTGSNVFTGSQYVSGGLFVQEYSKFGKSGVAKALDIFGAISVTGSVTTQVNSIGGFIGNFYNQWDSFGSQGGDGGASVGYFVGNQNNDRKLRLTSDSDIQLNHGNGTGRKIQIPRTSLGESRLELSGSLAISSSATQNWYLPKISVYNPNASNPVVFELNKYDSGVSGYYNFTITNNGNASGTTFENGGWPIKLMTNTIQLSNSGDLPGLIKVIGKLDVTGSMGISGSIIPAVAAGQYTSSFSLGSPTAAWKDIYVSDGTINFLSSNGNIISRLSATATGMSFDSDILLGTGSYAGITPATKMTIGNGFGQNPTNIAIGRQVLDDLQINESTDAGMFNIGIGSTALTSVTTGKLNTAVGDASLLRLNIGTQNVGFGDRTGYEMVDGDGNVFVGSEVARLLAHGNYNIGIGIQALLGANAVNDNFVHNTAIGANSGQNLSGSSSNNILIGKLAGPQSVQEISDKLYIGHLGYPLLTGSLEEGNLSLGINGATTIESTLKLKPQNPLPTGTLGTMAVSGSNLYFHNGSDWKEVLLVV